MSSVWRGDRDLVDTRERVKHIHIRFRKLHFILIKNVAVLHADVVFLIEETLFLDSCHVEDIQFFHRVIKTGRLTVLDIFGIKDTLFDIIRYL